MTSVRARLLLVVVATAACSGGESPVRDAADTFTLTGDTTWLARPASLGPIRVGMRRPELVNLIGQPSRVGYVTHERCRYTGGSALPPGVRVMTMDSVVVRVDVMDPGVQTAEGIEVGDPEAEVLARYGTRAVVSPHKYSGPEWHYVTVTPASDTAHRIVFETDGRVVRNYRVGRVPEVEWVEGCS